jgi:hypothetical protein
MCHHKHGLNRLDVVCELEGCMAVICRPTDIRGDSMAMLFTIAEKNHASDTVR